ncbi:hypothetical protein NDU88_011163 [Pleurodeles waltl]|uniref:Uncharacterized protein n=1 Tax=Pleurodeles waltl TaxID=8319 RepID=A0AAV7S2Q9_PLEWA|nr:hypothetical protein NDU88_011163 [Pleurodeles waltl]
MSSGSTAGNNEVKAESDIVTDSAVGNTESSAEGAADNDRAGQALQLVILKPQLKVQLNFSGTAAGNTEASAEGAADNDRLVLAQQLAILEYWVRALTQIPEELPLALQLTILEYTLTVQHILVELPLALQLIILEYTLTVHLILLEALCIEGDNT